MFCVGALDDIASSSPPSTTDVTLGTELRGVGDPESLEEVAAVV